MVFGGESCGDLWRSPFQEPQDYLERDVFTRVRNMFTQFAPSAAGPPVGFCIKVTSGVVDYASSRVAFTLKDFSPQLGERGCGFRLVLLRAVKRT